MKMTLEPPKRDEETAEFNSAFAFLERLNQIEYLIESALMEWNLHQAYAVLESYENELSYSFKEDDKESVKKIKTEIIKIFNENQGIGERRLNAITKKWFIIGQSQTGTLRNYLIELNQLLRSIKQKKGMGMPSKSEGKLF